MVRRHCPSNVARLLSDKTGDDYDLAVDAGKDPWEQRWGKVIKSDTAILLNSTTLRKEDAGRYIKTRYRGDGKIEVKKNAFGFATEREGVVTLPLVSVHVPERGLARPAKRIARAVRKRYPSTSSHQVNVIGGEFNVLPISYHDGQRGAHTLFWKILNCKPFRYSDTLHSFANMPGVDYIFGRGGVANVGLDSSYDPQLSRRA